MKRISNFLFITLLFSSPLFASIDQHRISQLTGAPGQYSSKDNAYKVYQRRDDLQISMTGMKVMPSMGLVSWAAFKNVNNNTSMQGYLVLTEDQISPVMEIALKNGLSITALENHYLWESPKVMFMHIEGSGNQFKIASAVGKVFNEIKATSHGHGNFPLAMMDIEKTTLNPSVINQILQTRGSIKNGVYKVVFENRFGNEDEMGLSSWASFAGTDREALAIGDMATSQGSLSKVLLALQKAGFYIVSINPIKSKIDGSLVTLHYIGLGNTRTLAKGIQTALSVPVTPRSTNNITVQKTFNVYPIISYPELPKGSTNNSIILNLDMSYFNQSKSLYPALVNSNELTNSPTQAQTEKTTPLNEVRS